MPGKVALITGAAGGLGRSLTAEFLQAGWTVIPASRAEASWEPSQGLFPIQMDVTRPEQVDAAITEASRKHGQLDALILNAGITADALSWQIADEDWDRVMDVNLRGAFYCARAAAQQMSRQRDGHLIAISSYAGRVGARGQSSYAAAKAGLIGLMQSIARELGSRNVRANAVLPGVLETKMTSSLSPEQREAFVQANALKRLNSLDEVARFIAFLAETKNISGQVFQLDSRIAPWT